MKIVIFRKCGLSMICIDLHNCGHVVVENALELLQKAFVISVRTNTDAKPYISEAIQMLNLSSLE